MRALMSADSGKKISFYSSSFSGSVSFQQDIPSRLNWYLDAGCGYAMASRMAMSSALWEGQKEENEAIEHCKGYMLSSNLGIVWNFSQLISCSPIYPAFFFHVCMFRDLERWVVFRRRWSDGSYHKIWACSVKLFEVHCKANVCPKVRAGC